jgi:hypothetical protein
LCPRGRRGPISGHSAAGEHRRASRGRTEAVLQEGQNGAAGEVRLRRHPVLEGANIRRIELVAGIGPELRFRE